MGEKGDEGSGMLGRQPFRTAVSFWRQTTQIPSSLSPKRDCSTAKRVTGGSAGVKGKAFFCARNRGLGPQMYTRTWCIFSRSVLCQTITFTHLHSSRIYPWSPPHDLELGGQIEAILYDLYDLYDVYDLAHVARWEPRSLHDLL